MKITLMTYGSRGDVEPFLSLADGLTEAGWQVHLAAPAAYRHLLINPAVQFTGLPGEPADIVRRLGEVSNRNIPGTIRSMMGFVLPIAAEVLEKVQLASAGADVIVHTFLLTLAGCEISREQRIPQLSAQFFPVFAPTQAFPAPNFDRLPGSILRQLSHELMSQTFWHGSRIAYRRLQRQHPGLPDLSGWPFTTRRRTLHSKPHPCGSPEPPPLLFAFSPQVVPRPADWGSHVHMTGYWMCQSPEHWQPPATLVQFLEAGPPPVCFGAGSSAGRTTDTLTSAFIGACSQSGTRGVLAGRQQVSDLPQSIMQVDDVPYSWLFPRCAVVVHHGGAGTTAAGLHAGVPNVVLPVTSDQPFWARRVYELGVGTEPIPARRVTPERLGDALKNALSDSGLKQRAAGLGRRLQQEDGVQRAVEWIESAVLNHSVRHS